MELSQQRRSGIPISKTPNKLRINRAISKSNDGNLNGDPSSELDTFTLLEENISLKEASDLLVKKNVDRTCLFCF